ncbi:MAG TPA: hypothetical protein VKQ32_07155 [Polyangia bacterium]|nr:hypothetical protein [Polyangia bacterium]
MPAPAPRCARSGLTALAIVGLLWSARPARAAAGDEPSTGKKVAAVTAAVVLLIAPSEIGAFFPDDHAQFDLGWSSQVPVSPTLDRHRIAGGIDWTPWAPQDHVRGRIGYRYVRRYMFGGLGGSIAYSGPAWFGEAGVRFAPDHFVSFHLLARAEIAPAFDDFRGLAILVGWDMMSSRPSGS